MKHPRNTRIWWCDCSGPFTHEELMQHQEDAARYYDILGPPQEEASREHTAFLQEMIQGYQEILEEFRKQVRENQ